MGQSPPALDQLMKLPDSVEFSSEKRGGATRSEWRQRFEDARERVDAAAAALAKAQEQLASVVGSKNDWQFTPPGLPAGAATDSTANFQLRQEVKRQRSELARAKLRLRDLQIEANLAGVPEDWRGESTDASSGGGSATEGGAGAP